MHLENVSGKNRIFAVPFSHRGFTFIWWQMILPMYLEVRFFCFCQRQIEPIPPTLKSKKLLLQNLTLKSLRLCASFKGRIHTFNHTKGGCQGGNEKKFFANLVGIEPTLGRGVPYHYHYGYRFTR